MKIEVTQEDIDEGLPCDPCLCPVGRAITRQTGDVAFVGGRIAYLGINNKKALISQEALIWIGQFDSQKPVKPFQFDLQIQNGHHNQ